MSKALVLHSGGIDSSTCLAIAREMFDMVESISIDYGQRHSREIDAAHEVSTFFGIHHRVVDMPEPPKSMLTDSSAPVPNISYDEITGVSPTYVPFRNGQLLARLAGIAQDEGADAIFFGAHAEDAKNWAYPDCTPEFIGAMANAIWVGTYMKVRLHTPIQWMFKHEIIALGAKLGVPFELTWSCYKGEHLHCGVCPTCRARRSGFEKAGVADLTKYANDPNDPDGAPF